MPLLDLTRTPEARPRRRRVRLSPAEQRSLLGMASFVTALHVLGWGLLIGIVAPQQYRVAGQLFGMGLGVTAYTLGMRHAFDADHIAAIDTTTRKLMGAGDRPLSVGFWFSLGHSSVVFVMVMLVSLGIRALAGAIEDDGSTLQQVTGLWGPSVSGVFLLLIGLVNLAVLVGIVRVFRRMRSGPLDEVELERQLDKRGFVTRLLGRVTRTVNRPWHMYPVGLLFGLGFDTVTEVGLLVIAGGAAAASLPWYAVLVLPVLFAAGMSLLDTIDGSVMTVAYGWALSRPVRRIYYNIAITSLSVAVALSVGGIEIASVVRDRLGLRTGPLAALGAIDLGNVGYWIVALFVATWVLALAIWRFGRIEERWSTPVVD